METHRLSNLLRTMEPDTKQSWLELRVPTSVLRCTSLGNICLPAGRKVPKPSKQSVQLHCAKEHPKHFQLWERKLYVAWPFRFLLGNMEHPESVTVFQIQLAFSSLAEPVPSWLGTIWGWELRACWKLCCGCYPGLNFFERKTDLMHSIVWQFWRSIALAVWQPLLMCRYLLWTFNCLLLLV